MEAGRLGLVHKQEVKHRRFVCVMNDLVKSQQDLMDGYIKRDKHETAFRYNKDASILRKTIVRQRVLQKCLKTHRDGVEQPMHPKKYGVYDGIPLEYMSKDIDAYIERMHPRIRRKKKVQRLMQNSLDRGAILAPNKIVEKIDDFFSGNYRGEDKLYRDVDELEQQRDMRRRDRVRRKGNGILLLPTIPTVKSSSRIAKQDIASRKHNIKIEPVIRVDILKLDQSSKSDIKKSASQTADNPSSERKLKQSSNKFTPIMSQNKTSPNEPRVTQDAVDIKHPRSKNLESVVEDEEAADSKSRGSLILPPLRVTKALVQR